jgi:hypothetical protein
MKIPVFVSCPSKLNTNQQKSYGAIIRQIKQNDFVLHTLGKSDYPTKLPLQEVLSIARHCSGGIILGFTQFRSNDGVWKEGTDSENKASSPCFFPTPWNQLEAGVLFALGLPLLVFREEEIRGGIFDNGVTDVFIQNMPKGDIGSTEETILHGLFQKWKIEVGSYHFNK